MTLTPIVSANSAPQRVDDARLTGASAAGLALLLGMLCLGAASAQEALLIEARHYQRGDASVAEWGEPLSIGGRWAEYDLQVAAGGSFVLAIRYAAAEPRPVRIYLDGSICDDRALAGTTGSWAPATGKWEDQAVLRFTAGAHTLRIARTPCLPHITAIRLTPTDAPAAVPVLVRGQAALLSILAGARSALEALGGNAAGAEDLLRQVTDLATDVARMDTGAATPEAAKALEDLEVRVGALRVAVAGLRTETLTGSKEGVVTWAGDPQVKVFRDLLLPETAQTDAIRMEACRNTVEAAVACVSSFDYAGTLRASVTPLRPTGDGPPLTEITARFVGYVHSSRNTPGRVDVLRPAPADFPDPLLLDPEVTIEARQTQAVWISVRVPTDARPAEYLGSIRLTTANGRESALPIRLRVYRPALPDVPSFQMGAWGGDTILAEEAGIRQPGQKEYDDAYFAFLRDECLSNRYQHRALVFSDVPLWSVFTTCRVIWRGGKRDCDYALFDRFLATIEEAFHGRFRVICVGIAGGASPDKKQLLSGTIPVEGEDGQAVPEQGFENVATDDPRYRAFIGEFFAAMQEHLRAKGWLDSVYFKVLDEIPGDTLPAALRLRTHIKACAPEVRLDETVVDANMLGQEHVDLFCVGDWPGSSVSAQMAEMAARGQEVWTYNNYRNMVDLPAGHTRLMGWVSHLFGLGGYMHWAWAWNRDPWQDAYTDPFGAGEGFLVTLDRQRKRVLDSIRWELFRQTSQDFEMLRMLEQAGGDSKGLCKQLVRSFADPETDPERFRQVRHQLITQLDGL